MLKTRYRKLKVEKQFGLYLIHRVDTTAIFDQWVLRLAIWLYVCDIIYELSEKEQQRRRLEVVGKVFNQKKA